MKRLIIGVVLLISLALLFTRIPSVEPQSESRTQISYQTGRIVKLVSDKTFFPHQDDPHFYGDSPAIRQGTMTFNVQIKDEIKEASYHMGVSANVIFQPGDRVSIRIFQFDGAIYGIEIRHPERREIIITVIALFLGLLAFVGGKRGILAVAGLLFTGICIWFLLIPLTLAGYPVIATTLITLTLIVVATIMLLADVSVKSFSAILGCLGGIVLAAIFSVSVGALLHISGYNLSHIPHLMHFSEITDISSLFTASVLIASIGAVMDTAVSISSSMEALKLENPQISQKSLLKAGFNIGRDVMATMSNTLILAFMGGSLSLLLFMHGSGTSFNQFINHDFIIMEIIKGIAGSVGIILAAPLTAHIASRLYALERNKP